MVAKWSHVVGKEGVAGSNRGGDLYFHLIFSLVPRSSKLGGVHANEIISMQLGSFTC